MLSDNEVISCESNVAMSAGPGVPPSVITTENYGTLILQIEIYTITKHGSVKNKDLTVNYKNYTSAFKIYFYYKIYTFVVYGIQVFLPSSQWI